MVKRLKYCYHSTVCCRRFTAEDVSFGRIETEHSFSASNVFKIDAWNSMVIFRNHHPLNWSEEEFMDAVLNGAGKWWVDNEIYF